MYEWEAINNTVSQTSGNVFVFQRVCIRLNSSGIRFPYVHKQLTTFSSLFSSCSKGYTLTGGYEEPTWQTHLCHSIQYMIKAIHPTLYVYLSKHAMNYFCEWLCITSNETEKKLLTSRSQLVCFVLHSRAALICCWSSSKHLQPPQNLPGVQIPRLMACVVIVSERIRGLSKMGES